MARRVLRPPATQEQVVPALGQGQKNGQQKGHDDNPVGDGHRRGHASRQDPEHKAQGNADHVDDGLMFEKRGVGHIEEQIGAQD